MMLRHVPLEPLVNLVNLPFLVSFGKFYYVRLNIRQIWVPEKNVATLGTSGHKDGCEKKEILEKA